MRVTELVAQYNVRAILNIIRSCRQRTSQTIHDDAPTDRPFAPLSMSVSDDFSPVTEESPLKDVLPSKLAARTLPALIEMGVETAVDLYECVANIGSNWYRNFQGIKREDAVELVNWLADHAKDLGEVTERFWPSGCAPSDLVNNAADDALPLLYDDINGETTHLSALLSESNQVLSALPETLSGTQGINRGYDDNSLEADDDLSAVRVWLQARAVNPNTLSQYRKEAERFLLWCTMERGKALSSITASDAALYPRWLEELGRLEPDAWQQKWNLPQTIWVGPKNAPRLSAQWRPFNGPLSVSSRKTSLTVVRILFGFLTKTGYLRSNPFDQVSSKVRYLPGEGAPKAFADRSLTPRQWEAVLEHLDHMPEGEAKLRIRIVLALGKGLGMRASEMIHCRADWIAVRRIGDEDLTVIEIVGKGDKVRRLPLAQQTLDDINAYFSLRELPDVTSADPSTPLLAAIRRKKNEAPQSAGISRSGLYRVLCDFFEAAAAEVQERSAADAAKLRAGSTHWLRHTFATNALKTMDINLVQNAMGHASIGTTSRYLTPEESQIAQAMKKLPAL